MLDLQKGGTLLKIIQKGQINLTAFAAGYNQIIHQSTQITKASNFLTWILFFHSLRKHFLQIRIFFIYYEWNFSTFADNLGNFYGNYYGIHTQPAQRRRKNVLILVSKTSQIGLKWKSRPFSKTSSRRLPGNALKTSSRKRPQDVFHETSPRRLPGDVKVSSTRRPKDLLKAS